MELCGLSKSKKETGFIFFLYFNGVEEKKLKKTEFKDQFSQLELLDTRPCA
jgi:hypothetical protein